MYFVKLYEKPFEKRMAKILINLAKILINYKKKYMSLTNFISEQLIYFYYVLTEISDKYKF